MNEIQNPLEALNLPAGLRRLVIVGLLLSALFLARAAAAAGPESVVEARLHVPLQQVDIDGDGRPEAFASDINVDANGAAGRIDPYRNFKFIVVSDAHVEIDPDGNPIMAFAGTIYEGTGSSRHEVMHALGLYHMQSGRNGQSGPNILVTIQEESGDTFSFMVEGDLVLGG